MPAATPLSKRIRRHVIGRPHPFLAVTAPGLEQTCAAELSRLLPAVKPRPVSAGVLFKARLDDAQRANLMLRTAGRILMRIARFHATQFFELEKALNAVAWELYLDRTRQIAVRVSTRKSRLYHSDAVAERLQAAVCARRRTERFCPPAESADPSPQTIFIRADHDRFTISLDTSGALLHKRGLKSAVGPAPIRETLAAAILQEAGYTGSEPLIDPMCGAGTFCLEAAMIARHIPPGWYRGFAFTAWPAFQAKRWAYLRETCGAAIRPLAPAPIAASDLDAAACTRLRAALAGGDLAGSVTVDCRDFFDLDPRQLAPVPGVAVINPPYGRRLGAKPESLVLFERIRDHLQRHYRGWRTALIAPPGAEPLAPPGLRPRRLIHGGLRLTLFAGTIAA